MPSNGFRAKKRCIGKAVNKVYTVPANTTSSLSVSVLAPSNAFVFAQSTDLDQVKLSTAQTYTPTSGWLPQADVPESLSNTSRTKNTQFALFTRVNVDKSAAHGVGADDGMGYTWQYRVSDTPASNDALDTSNSEWKTIGPARTTFNTAVSWDKGENINSGNADNIENLMMHPILDYRADPLKAQGFPMWDDGNSPSFFFMNSTNTVPVEDNRVDWGQSGILRYPDNTGEFIFSTGPQVLFTGHPSYGSAGAAIYGAPNASQTGLMVNGSDYISVFTGTPTTMSNGAGFSNYTTSNNWVRTQTTAITRDVLPKQSLDVMFTGTESSNSSWYVLFMRRTGADGEITLARKDTTETPTVDTSVERTTTDAIDPGGNAFYPHWVVELNGYYYCAVINGTLGGSDKFDSTLQQLWKTDNWTTGTWSQVSNLPNYVDLGVKPIIIDDNTMLFAKFSDQTNNSMTYAGIEVDNSCLDASSSGFLVDFGSVGLAALEPGATDTWYEDYRDYSEIVTYVPPNQAVTDAVTDAGITVTGQRTVADGTTLYDVVLHTSDTSFRNILSTKDDRDDDSDVTEATNTSFERTNFVLEAGASIYVYTDSDDTIVQVYGYEDS